MSRVILICFKNFSNFSCEKRKVEKVFLVVDFLLYSLTFELQQKEESREDYRRKVIHDERYKDIKRARNVISRE